MAGQAESEGPRSVPDGERLLTPAPMVPRLKAAPRQGVRTGVQRSCQREVPPAALPTYGSRAARLPCSSSLEETSHGWEDSTEGDS